jgi:hypothetical protein
MTLLTPLALALAGLAVPIILMYILKLRRKQHLVSSTLLWQRALDDVQANAPWQRLRPSMLLLLQLLALLALVLALAGPAYTSSRHVAGDVILIVDESYGMQAHDVAPSRFAAALSQAHSLAGNLPGGNVASVIGMSAQPRLAIAESSDGGAIGRAIDGLRPGISAPNFLGALSLAASLARSGERTRVVVLTSRESGISSLPLRAPFPVEIVRIGSPTLHDLGITAFSGARSGATVRALVRIGNFGGATESSDLNLFVDGQLADVRPVQVAPGKQETLFWTDLPGSARALQVRLAHADDVDADKSAWAVTGSVGPQRVLLVTRADYFVETALSLDPAVSVVTVAPAAYRDSLVHGYDLVVFDGTLPRTLPAMPVLLLSPPAGRTRLPGGGTIVLGRFVPGSGIAQSASPAGPSPGVPTGILRYVDLSDVHIGRSRKATLPGWIQPVASGAAGAPLLAAGENNGRRLALTTFSLQESDWPLRISFPILIQNLLRYVAPAFAPGATALDAGQTIQLTPPPGTAEIRVLRPDGTVSTLPARPGTGFAPFAGTAQTGIYTATAVGSGRPISVRFAVNFLPARPAPASGPPDETLGAATSNPGSSSTASIPTNIGWAFALAFLLLLSAEWWFAFRR